MATIDRPTTFDQSLEAFATELDRYTQTSVDGSHYVRISALSGWMREATEWEGRYISRAQLLTNAAYSQTEPNRRQSPPIICEKGPKCCIIVLSILLDLSLGHRVHEFARRNVVDCNLPQNLATLKSRFKSLGTDGENLAHIFSKRQWKFSPAQFSYEMDEDFDDDRVIPICRKSHLNTGGTADVCQIVVQEEFVDSKLRLFLAEDVEAKYDDKVYGMVRTP